MNIPKDLKYTSEHEWLRVEGEIGVVGITDYAQSELTDIVFVEFKVEKGDKISKGDVIATIEAVKTVADVYSPVSGEVLEVNEDLTNAPDTLNKDPYGGGWLAKIKIENPSEIDELLGPEDYEKLIKEEE